MHYLAAQTPHKHRTLSNKHHTISHKHHTLRHKHPHYLKNTANDLTNIRLNHEEKKLNVIYKPPRRSRVAYILKQEYAPVWGRA